MSKEIYIYIYIYIYMFCIMNVFEVQSMTSHSQTNCTGKVLLMETDPIFWVLVHLKWVHRPNKSAGEVCHLYIFFQLLRKAHNDKKKSQNLKHLKKLSWPRQLKQHRRILRHIKFTIFIIRL